MWVIRQDGQTANESAWDDDACDLEDMKATARALTAVDGIVREIYLIEETHHFTILPAGEKPDSANFKFEGN